MAQNPSANHKQTRTQAIKKASIKKLINIYQAIGGFVSEIDDPFDHFYNGGTEKLLNDFTDVLKEAGVTFAEEERGVYYVASYITHNDQYSREHGLKPEKKWGICTDRNHINGSWCLTGFGTPDEAIKVINNPKIFDDYNGKPIEVIDAA